MSIRIMSWVFEHSPYDGKAQVIHLALADHANDDGVCYPGNKRIAKKARATEEYVRQVIRRMEDQGLVEEIEAGGGRGRQRVLRLLGPWLETEETPNSSLETPNSEPKPSSYRNHHESPPRERDPSPFDAFYAIYPRRDDKRAARKAWDSLAKKGELPDLAVILDGARRYAAQVEGRERRFVKLPATWLNAGSWGNGHDDKAEGEWTEWG